MDPPKEPTKPGLEVDTDAALAASAANAVEQWRTYQNAYALYQQQQAAYEQYVQKQATITSYEEQQAAYNQYLEAHNSYQKQLEQYEQQKAYQEFYTAAATNPAAAASYYPTTTAFPQAAPVTMPPVFTTPLAHVDPFYNKGNDHRRDPSTLRDRSFVSKRAKVYTSTNYYANPDDEQLFPPELKALFKDLDCGLCKSKMNSHISANVHYQSKVHEKKVIQWLTDWCERTGTPMPYRAPRKTVPVEPVGPNSLRCEACDLPLTSIQHANQHYTGKRHRLVVSGKKTPAGRGYFNKDGTWTRRYAVAEGDPDRFGIGQSFANKAHFSVNEAKRMRLEPPPAPPQGLLEGTNVDMTTNFVTSVTSVTPSAPTVQQPAIPVYANPVVIAPAVQPTQSLDAEVRKKESADCVDESGVFCKVCQIAVTSAAIMETHLKGVKHLKKLKSVGRMPPPKGSSSGAKGGCSTESILSILSNPQPQQNDWSLYRMPTGKYYCKTCNCIMADEKLFSQHWYGKKHKLKAKQEMEELSGNDKKTKGFAYRRIKKPYHV
uniref:Putative zinc finger protein n=1 Tax=Aedes aegypti TaxID=7159 RepID=A0A0N8ERW6_AEDAE